MLNINYAGIIGLSIMTWLVLLYRAEDLVNCVVNVH